jgi:hypothetical protein
MNRPTASPSFGPLARHIGHRRHERDSDVIPSTTTRLQGRAAWLRLFPSEGDAAASAPEKHRAESAPA